MTAVPVLPAPSAGVLHSSDGRPKLIQVGLVRDRRRTRVCPSRSRWHVDGRLAAPSAAAGEGPARRPLCWELGEQEFKGWRTVKVVRKSTRKSTKERKESRKYRRRKMVGQWFLLHDFECSRASIGFVAHAVSVERLLCGVQDEKTGKWSTGRRCRTEHRKYHSFALFALFVRRSFLLHTAPTIFTNGRCWRRLSVCASVCQ